METDVIEAQFAPAPLAVREAPAPVPMFVDAMRPRERVEMAVEIADAIKDVIVQRGWFKHIGESDHVYLEGWQFVASMAGATCKVVSSSPLPDGKGWEARAVVVRIDTGVEIGGGGGMCSRAESKWRGRDEYALRSMAETRSMSRALRGVFSFIIELAGYRATPAEEMPDVDTQPLRDEGRDAPPPRAAKRDQIVRVPQDDLLDLARAAGIVGLKAFGAWAIANVPGAHDLASRERKILTNAETHVAKTMLEALIPRSPVVEGEVVTTVPREPKRAEPTAPSDEGRANGQKDVPYERMTPRTQGRLFALFDERLSTDHATRHIFAAEHGVTLPERNGKPSFSGLGEEDARKLIRQLEMIPPPRTREDERAEEDAILHQLDTTGL